MKTYDYRFPVTSNIKTGDDAYEFCYFLEMELNSGMDCLMSYSMFPVNDPLDHVSLEFDTEQNINAITLHMYHQMIEGNNDYLKKMCYGVCRKCVC